MADEPNDQVPEGSSADQSPEGLPLGPLSRQELLRQEAELAAQMQAKLDQACQPEPPATPANNKLGARKDASFKAICTAPSINWTQVGSTKVPVPYQTVQDLSNSMATAQTVRFNGLPVYLLDQTTQPKGTGDERGTKKGIRSGTVTGEVKPVSGCKTVRIEGKLVVREGDKCTMNGGNNPGAYIAPPMLTPAPLAPEDKGAPNCFPRKQAAKDVAAIAMDEFEQGNLYRIYKQPIKQTIEPELYLSPIRPGDQDGGYLRTANNIIIALLSPFSLPAVLARLSGATEEAVSLANNFSAGLYAVAGGGVLRTRSTGTTNRTTTTATTTKATDTPIRSSSGLRITDNRKQLKYQPSSGVRLDSTPDRTTTILGSYAKDMKHIVSEMGNIKSTDLGPRRGDFNVLNVPDELYVTPKQFWKEYNKPWLDNAVARNDKILMATKPRFDPDLAPDGRRYSVLTTTDQETNKVKLSGFGREYLALRRAGYHYENGEMKK